MILDRFGNPINQSVEARAREYLNSINHQQNSVISNNGYYVDNIPRHEITNLKASSIPIRESRFHAANPEYNASNRNALIDNANWNDFDNLVSDIPDNVTIQSDGVQPIVNKFNNVRQNLNNYWNELVETYQDAAAEARVNAFSEYGDSSKATFKNTVNKFSNRMQIPQLPYKKIGLGASVAAGLYGANALVSGGNERMDRTAINTLGNVAGAAPLVAAGLVYAGLPGAVVGGLAGAAMGGYASDRVADIFDPTQGQITQEEAANALLNQHLQVTPQPYLNEAEARAELMAARQAQRDQAAAIRNYREQMMQQYGG